MRLGAWIGAALLAATSGCNSCSGSSHGAIDAPALGPMAPVADVDFAPYFATARAIVDRAPRPDVHPPQKPGDRVFLTYWAPGRAQPVTRTTGIGPTLLDSVVAASDAASKELGASVPGRIELDVLTGAESAALDPEMRDVVFDVGLHGWGASDGPARFGFVLPNEILFGKIAELQKVEDHMVTLAGDSIQAMIAQRAQVEPHVVERMHVARFTVSEHVEGAKPGDPPIALFRSHPVTPKELTPEQLVAAVRAGGDYLARMTNDKGQFVYLYDPATDQTLKGYGMLRHAGAIYALAEAYGELHVPEHRDAAERAVGYMLPRIKATPDGSWLADNLDEEQQKVGGGGLALVALARLQEVTGDAKNLETMRALARFMLHQQYPDGHFRNNQDVEREDPPANGKKLKREVFYFTGEALLGLVRLYQLDPQPQWLEAAKKGADWVIDVRDAHDDLKHQIHDHWMSYALHDLFAITKEPRYADHATKIARAILDGERRPDDLKGAHDQDYVGSFYDQGEITPTSTRLEALASVIEIARLKGEDEGWLRGPAMQLACLMRGAQIDDASVYFAKNPARAMGGVRESLLNHDVRIDYDQHAMSGWLRFARELRDPNWGKAAQPVVKK